MRTLHPTPPAAGPLGLSWPLLVALLLALWLLSFTTTEPLSDADTYMHLATGYWIFEHRAIPYLDPFSYTRHGAPWIAHEWLAQSLLAAAHYAGGWTGVVALTVMAVASTLAYLLRFLLGRMPPIYALLFTALAAVALQTHLLARPHVLAWPLLAIWLGTLLRAAEERQSPPWWLAGPMLLWANLHGSFTLGLALVAPIALEAVLDAPATRRWATLRRWSLFLGLATLAAMATPAGWKGIWFTFQLLHMKYLKNIGEWMPASSASELVHLELSLLVLLGLALSGYLRLPVVRLLMVLGLLHQALTAGRYISLFGLLLPMLIARPFGEQYQALSAGRPQAAALDRFFERLAAPARAPAIVIACLLALAAGLFAAHSGRHAPKDSITPAAAVDAALQAGATGHVLNGYGLGGYLIFRGIPVFIDGRADLYGDAHIEEFFDALASNRADKIQRILDKFDIGWTLIPPNSSAALYLDRHPDWRKVYEDETAVVHLRQNRH